METTHDDHNVRVRPSPRKRKRASVTATIPGSTFDADHAENHDATNTQVTNKRGKKSKDLKSKPVKQTKMIQSAMKSKSSDRSWHESAAEGRITAMKRKIKPLAPGAEEIRLRDFVTEPSNKYYTYLQSATAQRMYVINRDRDTETQCHANHEDCPCETLQIAGSKGNVYTVTISHLPSCSCPVGIFQNKGTEQSCKHILYVLHHVLKAPDQLKCQNAFLTAELRELFANAPIMSDEVTEEEPNDSHRKQLSDDCPICFTEFEAGEDVVWCKAACGNNIHKACFEQWARAKAGAVTCPFCRTAWQSEDASRKQTVQVANIHVPSERVDGYRNVRHLLDYD